MLNLESLSFPSFINNPTEFFDFVELIGQGSYGQVYKAIHKKSGLIVAIKNVQVNSIEVDSLIQEINILKECKSDYIVKFYGTYQTENSLSIVLEYCAGGSVIDFIKKTGATLTEQQIAAVLYSTLKALSYLHKNKKIHRDIKCANILLNSEGKIKIADFGVSTSQLSTLTSNDTVIGTPFWMSPEIISHSQYNTKTDIWSLGISALEMAEGQPPYSDLHPFKAMFQIKDNPPAGLSIPSKWSHEFNEFVRKCLEVDPEKRPNSEELLREPFVCRQEFGNTLKLMSEVVNLKQNVIDENDSFNENGTMIEHKDIIEMREKKLKY